MSPLQQFFLAAGIIGVVAFIMATTPFLQIVFGQPKIGFAFDHDDSKGDGRVIRIRLANFPVTNRLLKALKVSRLTATGLHLAVQVFNASTGEVVANSFMPEIGLVPSDRVRAVDLPPSIVMKNAVLAKWQRATSSAVLFANRVMPLQEGTYIVGIRIELGGKIKIVAEPILHVGKTETEMMWDDVTTNKIFFM